MQLFLDEMARRYSQDNIVIDGAGWHTARDLIAPPNMRLLFLPPYSPELNPIENAFSKLKAGLRKASQRTAESLWSTIGALIPTFTPQECANFFKAAGYESN